MMLHAFIFRHPEYFNEKFRKKHHTAVSKEQKHRLKTESRIEVPKETVVIKSHVWYSIPAPRLQAV
jgi:hypothetical protein